MPHKFRYPETLGFPSHLGAVFLFERITQNKTTQSCQSDLLRLDKCNRVTGSYHYMSGLNLVGRNGGPPPPGSAEKAGWHQQV